MADQRIPSQGGGYGQTGPHLNSGEREREGFNQTPPRVPPSRDGAGYHGGEYEAENYRAESEREPQDTPPGNSKRWADDVLNTDHSTDGVRPDPEADGQLEREVTDALMADEALDATDIRPAVLGGHVTLEGTVDSREARLRAEEVASRIEGVAQVRNELKVYATNVAYTPPSPLEGSERPYGGSGMTSGSPSPDEQSVGDLGRKH